MLHDFTKDLCVFCLLFHWLTFPPNLDVVMLPNVPHSYNHFWIEPLYSPLISTDFHSFIHLFILLFIYSTNIIFLCRNTALGTVLVFSGCHNKIPKTWWFKQQKHILSQLQRLGSPLRPQVAPSLRLPSEGG